MTAIGIVRNSDSDSDSDGDIDIDTLVRFSEISQPVQSNPSQAFQRNLCLGTMILRILNEREALPDHGTLDSVHSIV
jgi:hypothetical protein